MDQHNQNEPIKQEESQAKHGSFIKELLGFAFVIVFIVLPIRLFVAQPFVVVGTSMEPTFANNDYLIVDEISYKLSEPQRGDVVVFKYEGASENESNSKYFIKRVIGLPGETIDIKNGIVTVFNDKNPEGFVLEEPYRKDPPGNSMKVTLDEGNYFVMGDNRAVSFDSRSWGPLEEDKIIGKVFVQLLPADKIKLMPGSHAGNYTDEKK